MQIIGREAAAMFLQMPVGRADRLDMQRHRRLARRAPALFQVAWRAGSDDILPGRAAALGARDDMVEGQVAVRSAILAGEAVAQEQVEAGEGRELRRLHELLERDDRGQLDLGGRAAHLAFVMGDDIHPVEEHGLHGGLPRPDRQRIIGQRRIIGVQHKSRTRVRVSDQVGMKHSSSLRGTPTLFAQARDMAMTLSAMTAWDWNRGQEGGR